MKANKNPSPIRSLRLACEPTIMEIDELREKNQAFILPFLYQVYFK